MAAKQPARPAPAPAPASKPAPAVTKPATSTNFESKPAAAPAAPAKAAFIVTHDLIAQRAYLKWMAKGGDAQTNWTEAERELLAEAGAKKR